MSHPIGSLHGGHDSYFDQYPAEADGGNSPPPLYVLVEGSNTEYQINPAIDLLHIQTDWLLVRGPTTASLLGLLHIPPMSATGTKQTCSMR